ncbi:MAG: membrane protein insertion efficiency factor YidD [Flavobacteriaceae bacterium]|nr:membrane protein insertion efficiency factor YidD [Flavobacteriaceae bacterium]|tara:strand:+ start:1225 stop:1449 length:225 start_codon:yes stop_codon:yes gene_type:complete
MVVKPLIAIIKSYQKWISPLLPARCRYQPTCSQYCIEALSIHGLFKGFFLGIRRVLRCHPWGGSGHDPVPKSKD